MEKQTRQSLAFHVGDRSHESAQQLWANLPEAGALEVLDIPRCVAWCPCVFWMSFHGDRGGNRYSVMAKIVYTSSA